jgi:glycerophosphoryl diester phosphodiesterase
VRVLKTVVLALVWAVCALVVAEGSRASTVVCVVPTVAAHKGDSLRYTESTQPALAAAYNEGARIWDVDMRFTRTNVPMILHDPTLAIFGSNLALADVSYTYAKSLRSSSGAQILSLWDFTQLMRQYPVMAVQIELKTTPTAAEWTSIDVRLKPFGNRVTLGSFWPSRVRAAQAHHYLTGIIDGSGTLTPAQVRSYGTKFYEQFNVLTATYAAQVRAAGVTVEAWTPDTEADWARLPDRTIPITDAPQSYHDWYVATHCQ